MTFSPAACSEDNGARLPPPEDILEHVARTKKARSALDTYVPQQVHLFKPTRQDALRSLLRHLEFDWGIETLRAG